MWRDPSIGANATTPDESGRRYHGKLRARMLLNGSLYRTTSSRADDLGYARPAMTIGRPDSTGGQALRKCLDQIHQHDPALLAIRRLLEQLRGLTVRLQVHTREEDL